MAHEEARPSGGLCTVDEQESNAHFDRMALHHAIERHRELIANYMTAPASSTSIAWTS